MDTHSFQASLKAIEHVCTHEKTHAPFGKKASHKNKAGAKRPSNGATRQACKKAHLKKSCELCKKHGARILRTLPKIAASMRKTERQKPISGPPRRQVRNLIQQSSRSPNWARNWTSWKRLLRSLPTSLRNAARMIATPIENRKLGWVALGN